MGIIVPRANKRQKPAPLELWPPLLGRARVRERYAARFAYVPADAPQRARTKKPRLRNQRPYLQYTLRQGRHRGIPMKSDVLRSVMVLVAGFVLGGVSAGESPA